MSKLPEGDVTFFFTDLEGSTRLLERDAAATGLALARHHELLAEVVTDHGGVVFETVGDAVYAAFARPLDAMAAAIAGQRALAHEDWGAIGALRARMAIHGGPVELHGAHYFGPALFRCARLQALGHGGQTLVSHAVVERLSDGLSAGVALLSLGSHRLKDLSEPERVYQLSAPDLPTVFPALRSLGTRPNNLPVQSTSFVGRRQEMTSLTAALESSRLVTLMGPGGSGKTRLALQVAADVIDLFPDGVFFVPLATVTDRAAVLPTVASTLAIHDVPAEPALETLTHALRDQKMLLVLDNLEQVLGADVEVAALVAALPGVTILVTSRVALNVRGERRWPMPTMELPSATGHLGRDAVATSETVQLYIERARDVRPDFVLTNENASDVASICRRLDGLPLAIELAAARTNILEPRAMLARLEHRLALLAGGGQDLPERQRTLRATIAWSWDLLAPQEQALAALLAVFVGGSTLQAAEAICADEPAVPDPLGGVAALVDASLLKRSTAADGASRFTMLETIHEFATEQLAARPDAEDVRLRHALWVTSFVERAELRGPAMPLWLERTEVDHDNIRAALDWSIGHDRVHLARRIVAALWKFWWQRGHTSEGRHWADAVLGHASDVTDDAEGTDLAGVLNTAGVMILDAIGEVDDAITLFRRAIAIYRRTGPPAALAETINNLGAALSEAGQDAEGAERFRESLALARAAGDRYETCHSLVNLGEVSTRLGDFEQAERLAIEAVAVAVDDGDPEMIGAARTTYADALVRGGDLSQARSVLTAAFESLAVLHAPWSDARGLLVAARFFERSQLPLRATRSLAAAETWYRGTRSRIWRDTILEIAATRRSLVEALGDESFEAAYAEGSTDEVDQAVVDILATLRSLTAVDATAPA